MTGCSRQPAPAAATSGFTLIETLVAMVLVSLLMVVVATGFQLITRAAEVERRAKALRAATLARETLIRQLGAAAPLTARLEGRALRRGLDGSSAALSFVGPGPMSTGGLLVQDLLLRASTPEAGGELVLISRPFVPATARNDAPSAESLTVLLPSVTDLRIRYFGVQADRARVPVWHDAWRGPALPLLVEIAYRWSDGIARHSQEVVIAPARASIRQN